MGIAVLIYIGAIRVDTGIITQGAVVALYNYMTQILVELVKFANLIISITKSVACAGRISAVLETPVESGEGTAEIDEKSENIVEFRNVSFMYDGAGENSLENISFTVKKGETVGIIGGTGSGKSTVISLIPRFYDATDGKVLIEGKDIKDYPLEQLRKKIGIVPQRAVLFKGTIRENMRWGKENATDEEIWRALELAQARDFVEQKPEKLDTMITQGGKNLSGGQRQRLTIARALVMRPDILILDDSSSALDYATAEKLRKALAESFSETTVFIVSQRAANIRLADKIIVLDDGQIAGIGTHSRLFADCPEYREICLSQMSEKEAQNG